MHSSFISMVDKAKRYADEPQRIAFTGFDVRFEGNNDTHAVSLRGDEWSCACEHFQVHSLCTHVMTLQRLFEAHLSSAARYTMEREPA